MSKLVRDKIIDIILRENPSGTQVHYKVLDKDEYKKALITKLYEECSEYVDGDDPLELADILEVVYALGYVHNLTNKQLNKLRTNKARTNGRFKRRLLLMDVKVGTNNNQED